MPIFFKRRSNTLTLNKAKNLLIYSQKVLRYRKHLMSTPVFLNIKNKNIDLKIALSKKNYQHIEQISDELDHELKKNGGDIYPIKILNDNTEVLLVASIIAIAIRAFFVQTFQIPTNSMYPTYCGITTKTYESYSNPSHFNKIYNKIFNGTSSFFIKSEYTGNLEIPLFLSSSYEDASGIVKFNLQNNHKFFGLFPVKERIYKISIGNNTQSISLPYSYSIDSALLQKFGHGASSWQELYNKHPEKFRITKDTIFYKPGYTTTTGENLIHFDIICGDMLFVDKLSYHFRNPKIGESIVFRTEKIKNIPGDPHYFIKRLIGKPGDKVQLKNDILYRNEEMITGTEIFNYENIKSNGYPGYRAAGLLINNDILSIPNGSYFVLGDNSPDSGDSRFWGFVPKKEVSGKPLFIFYPLNRAGLCK